MELVEQAVRALKFTLFGDLVVNDNNSILPGEQVMPIKNKLVLRYASFFMLLTLLLAIAVAYFVPELLSGTIGILFPISLFAVLLLAFYLLILSIKND